MDTTTSLKMTSLAVQSLFGYVEEENLPAIKAHLDKFRDVDSRSDNGQTPLMVASEQGNLEIVQELIRRGANVNLDDIDSWTSLICAAKEGHIEVVQELLENGANLEHRDMGGWTALMWAAYKGRTEVARLLLEKGANPNITGQYSVYPIIWAAGRGHAEIVHLLLQHSAKVNCSDKYGTTPLIWAARKGHYDSVMHLLANGADVDQEGANSMTALIVAVKGGYTDVVKELLKRNPNVNMTDKDGNTALAIAAKEGHTEIVQDLLDAGTYVNIPDRSGETMLIGAVRGGHVEIVRALLNKYADIDVRGMDGKTALYWAVEKGNATMVRDILQCNPDTESCTKDGETPLIKATKMRNIEIVELLLDKGAKVSAMDKKGDTPLHIAIRGRSRKLAELLLRNPKDGRLLYRPNKAGETPYNIDCTHQKSILTQIFGAKHLSPTESDGDMLGYDLYSSALADILSEPTMQPPICVGLYAQWGSGKSFLLKKLEDEMKTFAGQQIEPLFQFSWLVVFLTLLLCGSVAVVLGFTVDPKLAIAVSLSLLALLYIFFVLVYFGSRRERESWNWAWVLSTRLARHVGYLELLLKLMFVNPPELPEQTTRALPVRFLFTDYNRLSSVGGETSMAEMIATLSDACEREFGFMATRLFRVFKNDEIQGKKWKKTCCVPSFVLFAITIGCLITGVALLAIFKVDPENLTVNAVLIAMASVVGLALLLNCRTWWQVGDSVLNSQRKRLHSAANNLHKLKSEGFMKVLKQEVELMSKMAKTIDGFTQNQTRMAVIIDGLDACEQDKVLQMLDTVRVLFSKGPFISIFASDPHIIIKAINQNLNSVLRDSNINGHDYMRNIVHLPVFLNSRGLSTAKKLCMATPSNGEGATEGWHEDIDRKFSQNNLGQDQSKLGSKTALNRRDTYRRRHMQRTITRQMSFDLTKLLVTEDWFSDISPQTMRRLLNIVSITGRLLRANQILFNWDRLASWINLTEEWPYRTSWIILFLEETDGVSDQVTLKTIYERISKSIPTTKDVEPLLEIDGDIRSFEVFLSSRQPSLTARDVEMFLPCTVNLDPKLREIIADVRAAREQMHMGGVTYPTLPLQEAGTRGPSGYSQHPATCSPNGSFTGSLPPQPHSAYFSGMTGPQHPFYNRPYFPQHVYHLPRHYPHHPPYSSSRPPIKLAQPKDNTGEAVSPGATLSSLSTEAVCERIKLIDGIDPSMLSQYSATIKKANINGRVLMYCNLDELKKEMGMNFGDWQLFRGMVVEQRLAESQALLLEESRAPSEQGSSVVPPSTAREPPEPRAFSLNLSFEELSAAGLDEPPRQSSGYNYSSSHWPVTNYRTSSMSSLASQESSVDFCKLSDRQQAKYNDAYREYISQVGQLEGSGAERTDEKTAKEGLDHDCRKPFPKPGSKGCDAPDFSGNDIQQLDPISEEDEKLDHSSSSRVKGDSYQKLPSDEDSGPEEDNTTPLLHKEKGGASHRATGLLNKPTFLSDILLDKKDSSDSGMRSSDSSSDRSLEEVDPSKANLMELEGLVKMGPSRLPESTVARMSICSEAASEASLMASSPDADWPSDSISNLNNNSTDTPPTNSNANNSHQTHSNDPPTILITPGNATTTVTVHHNRNLQTISLGDERESVL
ncbi:kinase D-interacting substrate of 220 kDa B isoform X1 [Boleophthalmus pectinirostris]|uniref:kinase D-interacting substrate of 220 kDa B isoform X1 n=1 Tax=Boleophthalmus pectinirostris TaxID=150288 RepID=UPI000A1C5E45|nr:kinase D-interacting substrate of 220 kDa B isoform X1 [Boleophthalmus pectinirostris]XP_055015726.1 kinase D-interacting substrate of 220 kDa B isoform X1 [Boleophthalmus pectinirostris]XP_055015733.1 kinase D-interacting substrate of 220 kDa B isoform X1 [Boleophthalmus pectinirostris]XP_055015735.1 kinase D-interacting substrate of 220 kDa B isoform X1 [Boleophthalmus pectinirostris]